MSWQTLWEERRTPEDLLRTALSQAGQPGWPTKWQIIRAVVLCLRMGMHKINESDETAQKHLVSAATAVEKHVTRKDVNHARYGGTAASYSRDEVFRFCAPLKDAAKHLEGTTDGEIVNAGLQVVYCVTHTPNHGIDAVRRISRGFAVNACHKARKPCVLPKKEEATWYSVPEEGKKAYRESRRELLALLRKELRPDFDVIEGKNHG